MRRGAIPLGRHVEPIDMSYAVAYPASAEVGEGNFAA
jgi:hypothetical protein